MNTNEAMNIATHFLPRLTKSETEELRALLAQLARDAYRRGYSASERHQGERVS